MTDYMKLGPMVLYCCSYTVDGLRFGINLPAMEKDEDLLKYWSLVLPDFRIDGKLMEIIDND